MNETPHAQAEDGYSPEKEAAYRAHFLGKLTERHGGGIGFLGAHRTGKTTLCQAMTQNNPTIPFVQTSTSGIARQVGFDVNAKNSFTDRLMFQEIVLEHHAKLYEAQTTLFFTDRTPLDMAAYLLADVPNGEIEALTDQRVTDYLTRAADITNANFMMLIGVQPGIAYVAEEGKPAPNIGYQEKLNALMLGLGRSYFKRTFHILDRSLTNMNARMNMVGKIINKDLADYYSMLSWLPPQ